MAPAAHQQREPRSCFLCAGVCRWALSARLCERHLSAFRFGVNVAVSEVGVFSF